MTTSEWRPLIRAIGGALLILALALGARARADRGLLQTVPTPTPMTVPTPGAGETPRPPREAPNSDGGGLGLGLQVQRPDVLPGEELVYTLALTNTSPAAITGIVLTDLLHPALDLLEVRATQGAAEVQARTLTIHVGTLEAGQSALVVFRTLVGSDVRRGQIILNQATAYHDGEPVQSNVAAAGLPPDELPATGQKRRGP